MKTANMEPVKTEEFKMDFHLDVISRLYDKVSVLGVEDVVIVDESIGDVTESVTATPVTR